MTRILVDGSELAIDRPLQTWGDLLDLLDGELVSSGRIVTGVRLDGVDIPAFRDAIEGARPMAELTTIEVDAGTPAALLERCLSEASEALTGLCDATLTVGDAFRSHEVAVANAGLVEVAQGLQVLMTIVGAAGLALRVDLQHFSAEGVPVAARLAELGGYLEQAVNAQQTQDWITVADILQYDIEPSLRQWRAVLDELCASAC